MPELVRNKLSFSGKVKIDFKLYNAIILRIQYGGW
jgi:hypothetical protein